MKLGAQLYSLRTFTQTAEDLRNTILKCKAMGYENVQLSGIGPIAAEDIKKIRDESGMDIVLTHIAFDRIVNDTDKLIEEHKLYGCPVIGLGSIPSGSRGSKAAVEEFIKTMREPVRKIEAAGLRFGYHNHYFEFDPFTDAEGNTMELLLKECPTWDFTLDLYWVEYANQSAIEWLGRVGKEHLDNVHLKDMSKADDRAICACGNGRFDLKAICEACEKVGVKNLLVEQDNAVSFEDPFGQMETSFKSLRPCIKKEN